MIWADLGSLCRWLENAEPMLPFIAGSISVAILLGCAVTSWLAPSEKKDCLFHREVL